MTADDDNTRAAAHYYADLGLRVVPVKPGTKRPVMEAWQDAATTDHDQIDAWWDAAPGRGVSIVTGAASGVWVLDVDEHEGVSGSDMLADLEATYGRLPDTPTVLTGGGGQHLYFAWPDGVTIRNDAGKRLGPGLDVRAEGGQVVAPPTRHKETGQRYVWETSSPPAVTSLLFGEQPAFAAAPAWLIELLAAPRDAPERPREPRVDSTSPRLPGEHWAQETSWHDVLTADGAVSMGWRKDHRTGTEYELWSRPGLNGDHASATLGYGGSDVLKVFSPNWPGLTEGDTYTRFGYYTAVHHGGDFQAARAALEADGYVRTHVDLAELVGRGNGDEPSDEPPSFASLGAQFIGELLDGDAPDYNWAIPGLIERGDRVIFTGVEGRGKSTLLRQLSMAAADGRQPFTNNLDLDRYDPMRVLMVDCENSRSQLRRELPKARGPVDIETINDRLLVYVRTDGLVLDDPRDRDGDRAVLATLVELFQPDILAIGPLYKLLGGDPNLESDCRPVALFLDALRGPDTGMAIVIEAHAPHNQQRPYGWSGWKRWPEFGLHLDPQANLRPFRGGRDDSRHWPMALRRGEAGEWPWVPVDAPVDVEPRESNDEASIRQKTQRILHELCKIDPGRGWSMAELCERIVGTTSGKAAAKVRAAVWHYADRGWLIVAQDERQKGALSHSVETFRLDPDGPAGDHSR